MNVDVGKLRYSEEALLSNHQVSNLCLRIAFKAQKLAIIYFMAKDKPWIPDGYPRYLRSFKVDRYRNGAILANTFGLWVEKGARPNGHFVLGYHPLFKAAKHIAATNGGAL